MPDGELAAALGYASAAECLSALAPISAAVAKELSIYETLKQTYPIALNPATGTFSPVGPLPDRPPPGGPKLLRKKFRAFPYWKNRPIRKWADFAPMVKELHVAYDPAMEGSRGARELGLQARTGSMRKQFPRIVVKVKEVEDASPATVMIKWVRVCVCFGEDGGGGGWSREGGGRARFLLRGPQSPPPRPPQINDRFSAYPAHYCDIVEILEKFEVDRVLQERAVEEVEMF